MPHSTAARSARARRRPFAAGLLVSALLLAGCATPRETPMTPAAPSTPPSQEPWPTATPSFSPVESGLTPTLPTGDVPEAVRSQPAVQQAVADEAARLGVRPEAVEVAGYSDVTWRDGSLGCPDPGMMYTQALVPGHRLVLRVDGRLSAWHARTGGPFAYCPRPQEPLPASANPNA